MTTPWRFQSNGGLYAGDDEPSRKQPLCRRHALSQDGQATLLAGFPRVENVVEIELDRQIYRIRLSDKTSP
jgi:hypothetical protein